MRTAGNIRELQTDPVPDEIIHRVLDNARFAPSGHNNQGWRVIVVRDSYARRRLRDLYSDIWYTYLVPMRTPPGAEPEREDYADHLDEVPVHLVLLVEIAAVTTAVEELDCHPLVGGASIYPFVQNVLLGLRAEGLGAAFTALHLATQDQVRELLGIPDGYLVAGHIGVGWPAIPFRTRLSRNPVEDFATLDMFSGPPLKA